MQANHKWFKEAGYGMMAHWGLYSLLAGQANGKIVRPYAEWIQSAARIPNAEYAKLAKAFNPVCFDANEWIKLAKDSGMQYFVFTSKHHDGFAMFRSKADPYNVVDATPFRRDVTEELANACARQGIRFGLYYSQDLDWHEEHGGGYRSNHIRNCGTSWDNNWDFPDETKKDYSVCFEKKILPQAEEILTQYGELCLIWFDVPMTIAPEQSLELFRLVKRYQPDALINSRLGNGQYDYVSLGDNEIPDEIPEITGEVDYNDFNGFKPSPFGLYESAATMNDTWGFSAYDGNWKSTDAILANRRKLKKLGINYLLNVGPDPLGRIPAPSQRILREVRDRFTEEV